MKRIQFALCLLLLSVGHAQTLTKIVIDPPTQGFVIPPGSTTAQLTAQCLNNTTVITCPTLTWGVNYPALATVSSSGLVTTTNNISATITSWSITSNVLTVIANNSYAPGNLINITGLVHGSYINNVFEPCGGGCPLLSASSTQFTIALTHANDSATETGNVVRQNGVGSQFAADTYAYAINSATITNCAITGNVATLTATNTFLVGNNVAISGLSHCTALNGVPLTVATASSSQFTVSIGTSNVASIADSGTAQTSVLGHANVTFLPYIPASITFQFTAYTTAAVGSPVLITSYDDQNNPSTAYCAWTSSNTGTATINTVGEMTGVAAGSVNITCTYGAVTASRTITITNPTVTGNIYYYRSDGGTRYSAANTSGRCNGTANVADPGSGTNQNCAFNQPQLCWTDGVSTSGYTGAVQSTDRCQEGNQAPAGFAYNVFNKSLGVNWSQPYITPPSGVPGHPTQWWGFNHASCSTDPDHVGNRSPMITLGGNFSAALNIPGVQNFDTECLDMGTGQDCNGHIGGGDESFPCPSGDNPFIVVTNDFTSNWTDENSRFHGASSGVGGTPGPGTVLTGTTSEYEFLAGLDLDVLFGELGASTDGLNMTNANSSFNGCTEEQPIPLSAVSRDGAGNLNVTFPSSSNVNFIDTNNFVLTGASPSDLNGTYPVTSITFNQQTVNITGGTTTFIGGHSCNCWDATFTTSVAPTFGVGAFVHITGVTPSFINNTTDVGYEVWAVSGTGFEIRMSSTTRPNWLSATAGAISSGGTASTALSLVAAASGSSETATTVGTGGHVYQQHRCIDQGDGNGGGNGDAVGTGAHTIGGFIASNVILRDNTQDGWDMIHSNMPLSQVDRLKSSGNMGAPVKLGLMDVGFLKNSILVANAGKMIAFDPNKPPDFNQYLSLFFRAGDTMPIAVRTWSVFNIENNSWISAMPTGWDQSCNDADCTSLSAPLNQFNFQNNIFQGYSDFFSPTGTTPGIVFNGSPAGTVNANWVYNNNIAFNIHAAPATGTNNWSLDPKYVQEIANVTNFADESHACCWNVSLLSSSPAIAFGITNGITPATDYLGATRPIPPAAGALEFTAGPPGTFTFFSLGKLRTKGKFIAK